MLSTLMRAIPEALPGCEITEWDDHAVVLRRQTSCGPVERVYLLDFLLPMGAERAVEQILTDFSDCPA